MTPPTTLEAVTGETITDEQIRDLQATPVDGDMIKSIAGANDPHAVSLVERALRIMRGEP